MKNALIIVAAIALLAVVAWLRGGYSGGLCPCGSARPASSGVGPTSQPTTAEAAVRELGDAAPVKVVAYYFHRTVRCPSCLQIEEWAKQTVESGFANELANGLVEWRAVNVEQPGNEHFVKGYELDSQSLVLVRLKEGRPTGWKNLAEVWDLLGDHARFTQYVRWEMSSFLAHPSGATE